MSICRSVTKDCYATAWSYGEICVGCGCCSSDKWTRWLARLNYEILQREDAKHFDRWVKGWRRIQRRNMKANITYANRRIGQYKRLLRSIGVQTEAS